MRKALAWWAALPLVFLPVAAAAQATGAQGSGLPADDPAGPASVIEFSAAEVSYDSGSDIVTASGQVRMEREGNHLAADRVVWNRGTGEVRAEGNVVVLTPEGDRLIGESVVLTDSLRDGTVANLLVVLESGGRIAATGGTRTDGVTVLENAIYSPCPVETESGCPANPSWAITAAKVIYDPQEQKVRFQGGRLRIFGVTLPLLPVFSFGTDDEAGGVSGWLVPDISISDRNGLELAVPYYWRFSANRDLSVTPHVYSGALPAIEARYRELNRIGAFQVGGFLTYGDKEEADPSSTRIGERNGFRGYFEANGKAQFDPLWSLTSSIRLASDKLVTQRYDITRDARLRNFAEAERITPDSYVSIAGWAFQGLRVDDVQGQIPIALPAVDARFRIEPPSVGGVLELQANSLAVIRTDGQDTQRAFVRAQWDLRRIAAGGQRLTLTAFGRGDAYHTDTGGSIQPALYRGEEGWHFRGIGALAAEMNWPLIGPLFDGIQRLTPRVQLVLTPPTPNLSIPNEDARAVDLEDSNLFALSRFPGHDRWEDGSRLTYGLDWMHEQPNLSIGTTIGQSYRITRNPGIFPEGTGLTDRFSDYVGRTRVRYGRLLDVVHRFRLDKDNLAVRRNEVDFVFGTDQTYAQIGYLRLNRNISPEVEDLRDKEELRLAGRVKFRRHWSIFGTTVLDLTGKDEDPLSLADGFEPVRHRIGIGYEDECIDVGLTWRRDYERIGEFSQGSTFSFRLSLKGLGR